MAMMEVACPISNKTMMNVRDGAKGESWYLSNFEELACLGAGFFGCVFKVKNNLDGNEYALKKITFLDMDFEHAKREVLAISKVDHPNVVKYHIAWIEKEVVGDLKAVDEGTGTLVDLKRYDGPLLMILQEFCVSSLDKKMAELDEATKLKRFEEVLNAVEAIHSKGIRHGDLSPSNIFIGKLGEAKVGDFGLASLEGEGEMHSEYSLEAQSIYAAPELKNRSFYLASDIYSLGIILMELVENFTTYYEKCDFVRKLKANEKKTCRYDELIRWMIKEDPHERPRIEEVIEAM